MDLEEALERKIEELERQLRAHKKALQDLREASPEGDASKRFYKLAPIVAIRSILTSTGHAMPEEELHAILVKGGITRDRARGEHNIRISFRRSLALSKLKERNGLIGLPEWGDDLFVEKPQTIAVDGEPRGNGSPRR